MIEICRNRICALICLTRFGTKGNHNCHVEDLFLGEMNSGLSYFFMLSFFLTFISLSQLVSPAVLSQPLQSSITGCVSLRDWVDIGYIASDCRQAILRFIHEENYVHGDQEFEFLAPGTSPIHDLPTMATPRRYTVGQSVRNHLLNKFQPLHILADSS